MKRNYRPLLNVAVLGITLVTVSLSAQAQGPKYKEGDRVEFSENAACLGAEYAIPSKGTILKVDKGEYVFGPWTGQYVMQVDPLPGKAPRIVSRPISTEECGFRPLGGAAPKIATDKLRVDENETVLADRELLDCENLKHGGRNGSPPPVDLAKKLIRCLYEKPSPVGQDGATTPHRWRTYIDMGQGTANTLVYPVHVKYADKTFYRTRNVLQTDIEGTFTCFCDAVNLWQCGYASGPHKDGKTQEIVVKQ